jgi:hypothetical protein
VGRTALIYLHSTDERQLKLADVAGELAGEQLRKANKQDEPAGTSGTEGVGRHAH